MSASYRMGSGIVDATHPLPVGGAILQPQLTPTITAALYAAGNTLGGKLTLTNAFRNIVTGGMLQSLHVLDRGGQGPTGNIMVFASNPNDAGSTITDKTALTLSTVDDVKVLSEIGIVTSDWKQLGSTGKKYASLRNLALPILPGDTSLYLIWVIDNTPTFTATNNIVITASVIAN